MANANRQFQVTDPATLHALVRAQPLATLVIAHEGALHANHIPLFLDPHQGPHGTLLGHGADRGTKGCGWRAAPPRAQ